MLSRNEIGCTGAVRSVECKATGMRISTSQFLERLLGEVLWAFPTGKRPWGKPKSC